MDLKEIKELIALMRRNDLSVFKLEQENFKITLKRGADAQPVISTATPLAIAAPLVAAPVTTPGAPAAPAPAPEFEPVKDTAGQREITSPMVGTFYHAASPESAPYVAVGQEVTEETVVCLIEAMKVMNEIKAECRGVITDIVAENGKPVQFGQPLFRVR